jgi:hypothetical protein
LKRGVPSFQDQDFRKAVIESIRYVDKAIIAIDEDGSVVESIKLVHSLIKQQNPKAQIIFTKGKTKERKKGRKEIIFYGQSVKQGLKKTGPTIKELQEEYGGAGKFYIPEEEHYILENEDWRYDKWPEFFLGKNVSDFYDPEIVAKLNALEEEEEKLL